MARTSRQEPCAISNQRTTPRRVGDIPAPGGGPVGGAGEWIWPAAIRETRGLLWANWPPVHNLPDAETVARLSNIISSSAVLGALRRSDTFFAFVLRSVRRVLADHSLTYPQ